jgi:hypothetical protein
MKHIFFAPPFDVRSGGVKSFYRLFNHLFNLQQFDLEIFCRNQNFRELFNVFPNLESYYSGKLESMHINKSADSTIKRNVIFTETTTGLPFKAQFGTIWQGNVFGNLPTTQYGNFFPEKIAIFCNSSCISKTAYRLYINNIDFDSFNPEKSMNKNFYLIYTGKKFFSNSTLSLSLENITKVIGNNFILIDRGWPDSNITKFLVQNCKGLISFDPLTAIVYETLSCNKPVLLQIDGSDYWTESLIRRFDLPQNGLFINDVSGFINSTRQKLNLYDAIVSSTNLIEESDLNNFAIYLQKLTVEEPSLIDTMKSYNSLSDFNLYTISESISNRLSE